MSENLEDALAARKKRRAATEKAYRQRLAASGKCSTGCGRPRDIPRLRCKECGERHKRDIKLRHIEATADKVEIRKRKELLNVSPWPNAGNRLNPVRRIKVY